MVGVADIYCVSTPSEYHLDISGLSVTPCPDHENHGLITYSTRF